MNMRCKLVLLAAAAATVSMVDAAVANAYDTIDYGTNQAACQAADEAGTGCRHPLCRLRPNWAWAITLSPWMTDRLPRAAGVSP